MKRLSLILAIAFALMLDSDGGTTVSSLTAKRGEAEAESADKPFRKGFVLEGRHLGDGKYDFTAKVTKNMALKAKWTVELITPPEIAVQPKDTTMCIDYPATVSVEAVERTNRYQTTYQWFPNTTKTNVVGTPMQDAVDAELPIPADSE